MEHRWCRSRAALGVLGLAVSIGACGSSSESSPAPSSHQTHTDDTGPVTTAVSRANACPIEGCKVRIVSVTKAGAELSVQMSANYGPDVSRNHFHVYWNTFTSKQVSTDAEQRFGIKQGVWVATADNPFTTNGETSVKARKGSTRFCVTTGDRYHNVIDPGLFYCRDVSARL